MNPADRFSRLPDLLADDPDLRRRGRWLTVDCRVDIGAGGGQGAAEDLMVLFGHADGVGH